jgi:hypothetical protein
MGCFICSREGARARRWIRSATGAKLHLSNEFTSTVLQKTRLQRYDYEICVIKAAFMWKCFSKIPSVVDLATYNTKYHITSR